MLLNEWLGFIYISKIAPLMLNESQVWITGAQKNIKPFQQWSKRQLSFSSKLLFIRIRLSSKIIYIELLILKFIFIKGHMCVLTPHKCQATLETKGIVADEIELNSPFFGVPRSYFPLIRICFTFLIPLLKKCPTAK